LSQKHGSDLEYVSKDPILYGDYRNTLRPAEARLYEDLGDYSNIKILFEEILEEYNTTNKKMILVMFDDALEHVTRIHRIMRLDQVSKALGYSD
jgi:dynein heavy chain